MVHMCANVILITGFDLATPEGFDRNQEVGARA